MKIIVAGEIQVGRYLLLEVDIADTQGASDIFVVEAAGKQP